MTPEFRRELAQHSFEEKVRKVAELIRLSRNVKAQTIREETQNYPQFSSPSEWFNGAELSESVLGRDWNSEDAGWSNL